MDVNWSECLNILNLNFYLWWVHILGWQRYEYFIYFSLKPILSSDWLKYTLFSSSKCDWLNDNRRATSGMNSFNPHLTLFRSQLKPLFSNVNERSRALDWSCLDCFTIKLMLSFSRAFQLVNFQYVRLINFEGFLWKIQIREFHWSNVQVAFWLYIFIFSLTLKTNIFLKLQYFQI